MLRGLFIEPFFGGSHAVFAETLQANTAAWQWTALTLPARHWKWRMRGSAVWAADAIERLGGAPFDVVVATSYVPVAELYGLATSLRDVPCLLYFHENQFAYPRASNEDAPRDHHYAFTQLTSARAATVCVFNSVWNRDSFVAGGAELLARLPDAVVPGWMDAIAAKSLVLPLPVPPLLVVGEGHGDPPHESAALADGPPLLVWNHRWEHDKGPEELFALVDALADRGVPFRLAVLGERYRRVPAAMTEGLRRHAARVVVAGTVSRAAYAAWLRAASVVVSTARHEFFGIAMIEAASAGAAVVVPDRLSYVELYPAECRASDEAEQVERVARALEAAGAATGDVRARQRAARAALGPDVDGALRALVERLTPERVVPAYEAVLARLVAEARR